MSMLSDPSCLVPDGSFFNFASRSGYNPFKGAKEYYHDVVLECSSVFTDANIERIERAAETVREALDRSAVAGSSMHIDLTIEAFQTEVGKQLLEELRKGVDYVMSVLSARNGIIQQLFTKDLDMMLFEKQVAKYLGSTTNSGNNPKASLEMDGVAKAEIDRGYNLSHYASYLSNVAAWMTKGTALDMGSVHLFSLLLARGKPVDVEAEEHRRCNEALAVIAAEYLRRRGFVDNLGTAGSENRFPYGVDVLSRALWNSDIVSLEGPLKRLMTFSVFRLPDFLLLCVDNRLVRGSKEEGDDVGEPHWSKLDEGDSLLATRGVRTTTQSRTAMFPKRGACFELGEFGLPFLKATSSTGLDAVLFPADDKCRTFLARLYGVKLPSPLRPLDGWRDIVWGCSMLARELPKALKQAMRVVRCTRSMDGVRSLTMTYAGTHDLAEYLDECDSSDMFVNEYILY